MKTSELIDLLSATTPPVDTHRLGRMTSVGAMVALALAMLLVLATIGTRPDIAEAWRTPPVLMKVGFGAGVALIAIAAFLASLRPGSSPRQRMYWIALPFVLVAGSAIVALCQAPVSQWQGLIFGRHWLGCLVFVPLYALIPLAIFIALSRRGAPVEPRLSGLLAGLSSGGLAIIAYAMHCPDDGAPFLSTWYPLGLAVSGTVGAVALPRFARW